MFSPRENVLMFSKNKRFWTANFLDVSSNLTLFVATNTLEKCPELSLIIPIGLILTTVGTLCQTAVSCLAAVLLSLPPSFPTHPDMKISSYTNVIWMWYDMICRNRTDLMYPNFAEIWNANYSFWWLGCLLIISTYTYMMIYYNIMDFVGRQMNEEAMGSTIVMEEWSLVLSCAVQ